MNCEKHPQREGVAVCVNCGKVLCIDCRLKLVGKNYCQKCADDLIIQASEKKSSYEPSGIKPANNKIRPSLKKNSSLKGLMPYLLIFLIIVLFIALGFYLVYIIYLAPYYGDLQNVIDILISDPQRIINFLMG